MTESKVNNLSFRICYVHYCLRLKFYLEYIPVAEKTAAADKLQKLLNQARIENAELKEQVKGLESQLAELNQEEGAEPGDNEQAAA